MICKFCTVVFRYYCKNFLGIYFYLKREHHSSFNQLSGNSCSHQGALWRQSWWMSSINSDAIQPHRAEELRQFENAFDLRPTQFVETSGTEYFLLSFCAWKYWIFPDNFSLAQKWSLISLRAIKWIFVRKFIKQSFEVESLSSDV